MKWKKIFLAILWAIAPSIAHVKQHTTSVEKAAQATSDSLCFFIPPSGWEIADPKSLSPHVKIAFLKHTQSGLCPSINLAVEKTSVSLNEYLKAVRTIHEQDRGNTWRALGKVRTNAGLAQLTEIDSKSEWGPVRILQLVLLKDGYAYVVTSAALKEEFSSYYKEIQSAFRSLTLSSDLFSCIPQTERRESLKQKQQQLIEAAEKILSDSLEPKTVIEDALFQKKHWIPFQEAVLDTFKDMGAFWQVLLLRNTQEKLLSCNAPDTLSEEQIENE